MKHVLIVDDDREIVDLLRTFLERQGFAVSAAGSGTEMWALLDQTSVDLVILDVLLPGDDGITLCRELRAKSDVPIVLLTALDGETDRVVGLEVGADDYLVKPFSSRELLARLRAILRRTEGGLRAAQAATASVLLFDKFRFDRRRRELRTPDNIVVHLSRTEFELLDIFLNHPSRAIDRNEMSEQLRGHQLEAFDRSIDLHVCRLRNKLSGLIGNENFIKTIRGTGYMFTLDVTTAE